jgi:hypothetical protein
MTTELVVSADRLSVFGLTRSPKWQAISAMSTPNTSPLQRPIQTFVTGTTRGSVSMKKP